MKEFDSLELIINRNAEWLKKNHPFYLSEHLPLKIYSLPKNIEYLEEDHISSLRANIHRHWENFIINVMKELEKGSSKEDST